MSRGWGCVWGGCPGHQSHVCIISSSHKIGERVSSLCECLSFLQSTGTNRNEELVASQSLIQIPVVPQRTSGVIISWCLMLHLFSLSLPAVSMTYGVLNLKAADLFRMISTIG